MPKWRGWMQCRRQKGKEVGSTLLFVTTLCSLMSLLSYSATQSELCSDLFLWDRMGIWKLAIVRWMREQCPPLPLVPTAWKSCARCSGWCHCITAPSPLREIRLCWPVKVPAERTLAQIVPENVVGDFWLSACRPPAYCAKNCPLRQQSADWLIKQTNKHSGGFLKYLMPQQMTGVKWIHIFAVQKLYK